jgi:hypothetical protein
MNNYNLNFQRTYKLRVFLLKRTYDLLRTTSLYINRSISIFLILQCFMCHFYVYFHSFFFCLSLSLCNTVKSIYCFMSSTFLEQAISCKKHYWFGLLNSWFVLDVLLFNLNIKFKIDWNHFWLHKDFAILLSLSFSIFHCLANSNYQPPYLALLYKVFKGFILTV